MRFRLASWMLAIALLGAAGASPEETVAEFYRWYLHALAANREPLTQDRAEMKRYVSSGLIARIEKQTASEEGLDADYFLQAQDYLDDWEQNIAVSKPVFRGGVATSVASLGAARYRLRVSVAKESGVWKVTAVKRLRE